jgi:NAD(P)-dependent dehydrogenase (short-subunit alcohol dehydrogenase family)
MSQHWEGPERMDVQGAVAIVTGGASGLGEATARALAARGATVVLVDLQEQRAKELAAELGGVAAVADVADEGEVSAAVGIASELGPPRVLVNCAGISRAQRTVNVEGRPFDLAVFERVLRTNLVGTFNCVRLAGAAMAALVPTETGERGAIVNTASVAAFDGQIGQAAYAASKGGIVALTLPLARDLAAIGVRVNTLAPGLFDTPIYGTGAVAETKKQELGRSVVYPPRLGYAAEYAEMAVAVLTNSYMNGETIRIDGAIRLPPRSYTKPTG